MVIYNSQEQMKDIIYQTPNHVTKGTDKEEE